MLVALLMLTGCRGEYKPLPPAAFDTLTANITLKDLRELHHGEVMQVGEPLIVTGSVTTNDAAGNFYRTLIIEQEGAALEIKVGLDALHTRYPEGVHLAINLQGLSIKKEFEVMQAGFYWGEYHYPTIDYLEAQAVVDQHIQRHSRGDLLTPTRYALFQLREELCGTLVRLEELHYAPLEEEEPIWEGYRRFVDARGRAIHLYTSPYARFAQESIPEGEIALCGILQYISQGEHAGYLLKPRDERDLYDKN